MSSPSPQYGPERTTEEKEGRGGEIEEMEVEEGKKRKMNEEEALSGANAYV